MSLTAQDLYGFVSVGGVLLAYAVTFVIFLLIVIALWQASKGPLP